MKMVFWNIRGMGKLARASHLKDLVAQEQIDIIGIQETIKQSFSTQELENLVKWGLFS